MPAGADALVPAIVPGTATEWQRFYTLTVAGRNKNKPNDFSQIRVSHWLPAGVPPAAPVAG